MGGKSYKIAVVAGDGIGPEVIGEARRAAEAALALTGSRAEWVDYPFGAAHYNKTGEMLPDSSLDEMEQCDAMLLGAVGDPSVKPGILEQGILLKLRFHFDQYVNLRPAISMTNVPTPVKLSKKMDSVVVRENTEDLYVGLGCISGSGTIDSEMELERGSYKLSGRLTITSEPATPFAAQIAVNSRPGAERIARFACRLAEKRGEEKIAIVTKSNAVPELYGFFDATAKRIIEDEFPKLKYSFVNVDAMCYHLVRDPSAYGVVLCPNLFGDIISDLQAGLAGGLGTAAAGNIGDRLSMFEPVHGSAPDIAGTGKANPIAAIMAGAMMLRHVGEDRAASSIDSAVEAYLAESDDKTRPIEFGGSATCSSVGDEILRRIA